MLTTSVVMGLGAIALAWWTRRLVHRGELPPWMRHGAIGLAIAVAAAPWVTAVLLVRAFDIPPVDASQRASALAAGISTAMTATAIGLGIFVLWLIALIVVAVRARLLDG